MAIAIGIELLLLPTIQPPGGASQSIPLRRRRLPNLITLFFVCIVFAAAVWTARVLATYRTGAAPLLLAALVLTSLTLERIQARRIATALTIPYAYAVLASMIALYTDYSGIETVISEQFRHRAAALLADSRALASLTALRIFCTAPLMGSGLNTFRAHLPRFPPSADLLHYADHDYAPCLPDSLPVAPHRSPQLFKRLLSRDHECFAVTPAMGDLPS
jgi:hypothetical protein